MGPQALSLAALAAAGLAAAQAALFLWDRRLLRRAAARARGVDPIAQSWREQWQELKLWILDSLEAPWPRGRAWAQAQAQVGAPRLGALLLSAAAWAALGAATAVVLAPALACLLAALGLGLPLLKLRDRARRRAAQLRQSLPDAVDLISACVQAGQGLDQALQRSVAQLSPGPLKLELQTALGQLQAGAPRKEAFAALAERCRLAELGPILKAILRSEARGVALAPVLKAQSQQLRRLYSLRVQKAAAQAPIKMLFPLLLFILPAVFLVVFGPIFIQLSGLGF